MTTQALSLIRRRPRLSRERSTVRSLVPISIWIAVAIGPLASCGPTESPHGAAAPTAIELYAPLPYVPPAPSASADPCADKIAKGRAAMDAAPSSSASASTSSSSSTDKGFDVNEVRRVVIDHLADIRSCYEAAMKDEPGICGAVAIAWTIRENGAVTDARIEFSNLDSTRAERCMTAAATSWTFANPKHVVAKVVWYYGLTPPH